MRKPISVILVSGCLAAVVVAQQGPGAPEANGLTPKSDTIYINRKTAEIDNINNGSTESLGVAIANGGNVIVGWEDDGSGVTDIEAVWTMFDSAGVSITPDTETTCVAPDTAGSATTKFLSYFRADGSAVGGGQSWGPKIKANPYGDGVGLGATTWQLDLEVPQLAGYDGNNQGDYPTVQLLSNTGQPVKIVAGVSEAYATRDPGNIRIGDWDYLSNSNIVIVSESRQNADLVDVFGGSSPYQHIVFRILDPGGNVVKAETLVTDSPEQTGNHEMWHGAGSVQDGFAVRFNTPEGVAVRMFDNSGNPTSTNILLAAATGFPQAGGGGRGDGAGFHGNGKDAYVAACASGAEVWVTVLNTNGTVRFSKSVADDLTGLTSVGRLDAAISRDGNVIVVFSGKYDINNSYNSVMGRRFDAAGNPVGGTFYVSEKESPDLLPNEASSPRVAWRNGQVAVVWESNNDLETLDPNTGEPMTVVAMRLFSTFTPGSIESVGLSRIVPDTVVTNPALPALGNWEPYAGVLGNSTFLISCGAYAPDQNLPNTTASGSISSGGPFQNFLVYLQPAAGGAGKVIPEFYTDAGVAFGGPINFSRQNGNPPRVGGDTRPGAVNYVTAAEISAGQLELFNSDSRWSSNLTYQLDNRYVTVQPFSLNTSTLVPTPLHKAFDAVYGSYVDAATVPGGGNQVSRTGGTVVGLDNGNFAVVIDDKTGFSSPVGEVTTASIIKPDGTIVKDRWLVDEHDIWDNVAPFKGGFCVRVHNLLYFYDNNGTLKGQVDQADSGASFDAGRGDGTRIFGHINSPYVYLTGRAANTQVVKVVAFDSTTPKFVAIADVNEGAFTGNFDRAMGAVDALNRLTVSWVSQPTGYAKQQVAARVLAFDGTKFTPLTSSFFPFINAATNDIRSLQMTVAMTTRQICVAAKGEINLANKPELGPDSPTEINFFTVFSHPNPQDDPTPPVGGAAPKLTVSRSGNNLTIAWEAAATGFTLESKASLSDATWTTVGTANPTTEAIGAGNKFYRLRK